MLVSHEEHRHQTQDTSIAVVLAAARTVNSHFAYLLADGPPLSERRESWCGDWGRGERSGRASSQRRLIYLPDGEEPAGRVGGDAAVEMRAGETFARRRLQETDRW